MTERAREICGRCVDRNACLEWALTHKEEGIWGGTTTKDRASLKRKETRRKTGS